MRRSPPRGPRQVSHIGPSLPRARLSFFAPARAFGLSQGFALSPWGWLGFALCDCSSQRRRSISATVFGGHPHASSPARGEHENGPDERQRRGPSGKAPITLMRRAPVPRRPARPQRRSGSTESGLARRCAYALGRLTTIGEPPLEHLDLAAEDGPGQEVPGA